MGSYLSLLNHAEKNKYLPKCKKRNSPYPNIILNKINIIISITIITYYFKNIDFLNYYDN